MLPFVFVVVFGVVVSAIGGAILTDLRKRGDKASILFALGLMFISVTVTTIGAHEILRGTLAQIKNLRKGAVYETVTCVPSLNQNEVLMFIHRGGAVRAYKGDKCPPFRFVLGKDENGKVIFAAVEAN